MAVDDDEEDEAEEIAAQNKEQLSGGSVNGSAVNEDFDNDSRAAAANSTAAAWEGEVGTVFQNVAKFGAKGGAGHSPLRMSVCVVATLQQLWFAMGVTVGRWMDCRGYL